MKIRKARETDIPSILRLVKQLVDCHCIFNKIYKPYKKYSGLKKYFEKIIQTKNNITLVAEDDAQLVGFLEGGIEKASNEMVIRNIGTIDDLFVEEKYRKQGIGQKLLNSALKYFNSKNIEYIQINVDATNNIGKGFWEKNKFFKYNIKMLRKLK